MGSTAHRFGSTFLLVALSWSCSSTEKPQTSGAVPGDGSVYVGGGRDGSTGMDEGGTSEGGTSDGSTPPFDASTECNQLDADGPSVAETSVVGTAPTAVGGTIGDGTYVLTERAFFAASYDGNPNNRLMGPPVARTLVVSGASIAGAELTGGGDAGADAGAHDRRNWSYEIFNTTVLSQTSACSIKGGAPQNASFSVVGNDLWIFPARHLKETYTRQ